MFKTKTNAATLPTFHYLQCDRRPLPAGAVLDAVEHFANGCDGEPAWSATGALCEGGAVLLQTHPRNRFAIYVKVGRDWYELLSVDRGAPQIVELMQAGALKSYGYSPAEKESQRRKEDYRQGIEEAGRDLKARRSHLAFLRQQVSKAVALGEPRRLAARRLGLTD